MADMIDITQARYEAELEYAILKTQQRAADIKKGVAGECNMCGEHSPRLVGGACARCRDKFSLP